MTLCVQKSHGWINFQTSLLLSVVGEISRLGGFVRSKGQLGLVPQQPWIVSATFRENVLFGCEMDRRKYNKVLYACDLVQVKIISILSSTFAQWMYVPLYVIILKVLEGLPCNDLTVIGAQGFNLTAGQKAKIGLARWINKRTHNLTYLRYV